MTLTRKIAVMLVLIGLCLPTATMPFITEFHPQPEICLTSNFFGNLGNMIVVLGPSHRSADGNSSHVLAVPYRYLFSAGVMLICTGLAILVLTMNTKSRGHRQEVGQS